MFRRFWAHTPLEIFNLQSSKHSRKFWNRRGSFKTSARVLKIEDWRFPGECAPIIFGTFASTHLRVCLQSSLSWHMYVHMVHHRMFRRLWYHTPWKSSIFNLQNTRRSLKTDGWSFKTSARVLTIGNGKFPGVWLQCVWVPHSQVLCIYLVPETANV